MTTQRTGRFFYVFLSLIVAGLLYGLYQLLILRFQRGDVYPPYSSLRSDPLGTKAFFDGLSEVKNISVDRNYGPPEKLVKPNEMTLMDLGETREEVIDYPASQGKELEAKILQGARVVIALVGENGGKEKEGRSYFEEEPTPSPTVSQTSTPDRVKPTSTLVPIRTMGKEWGIGVGLDPLPKKTVQGFASEEDEYQSVQVRREGNLPVPSSLLWHSSVYFADMDPAWKVLYRRDDHPVAVERKLGKGSLVLLSDSYLLSNEAMQKNLHGDLLVYLIGDKSRVLFDETHLGVYESPNTATLARKYGLQGFALGLLLLAGLFIWRHSFSLVPPPPEENDGEAAERSGKDFSTGLVNLLKRNVPVRDVLRVCFEQWKRTFAQGRGHLAPKVREMERELEALKGRKEGAHPVEGYLRLRRILKKRR